ncbi:SDR family NAD(P)-dependent oxidoreductase [Moorena producens]|uniref:SDR family NAD(P)-dependent oxidoreductase n=1 Tax=Moorena producens TaxID=1155739 RepID=UPI003C745EE7
MSNNLEQSYGKLIKMASEKIAKLEKELEGFKSKNQFESIAIIGMGCRFPGGADNPASFWTLLSQGIDAISEIPSERWNIEQYYDPNPETPGKMYTRYGGFVGQLQEFDSHFFNIAPIEAISLDPQQRLLLEVSWEALEHAAYAPQQLAKTQTGVFMGICSNDYGQGLTSRDVTEIDAYLATGNAHSTATGRLSYFLGLTGPSIAVDTACSSSLVSVHLACTSLRNGECHLALAGGVNRIISPEYTINFSRARMLSPDGRCKTFDAGADGYVRSEGCGVVVLKRLSDAVADGDNILAVIRGTAINQDGHTSGLTVPNGPAQESVIRQALTNSGVQPEQVSYIEAHGTGTSLGDPIEVTALGNVFRESHSSQQPMIIGSVKTNIGHLEAAAGIAGLIKVVLQLQHQQIARHLHFHQPNPYINWEQLPVLVPTDGTPWEIEDKPRLAGLSSFGFSGTNAHVILEEAPSSVNTEHLSDTTRERPVHLLTLSTKDDLALWELVQKYQEFLEKNGTANLADICFTANTGRSHFQHRLAIIASNQEELAEKLAKARATEDISAVFTGIIPNSNSSPKIAFLFTGQGSQYVNMGRQLYDTEPIFRQTLDQCHQILQSYLEKPLKEVIYPQQPQDIKTSEINQTAYTQPALFAIEYALFKLWQSWGINPDVVMGHSVGEYVAATVAGVFSLEEGLKLIATRAKLMQQLPCGGQMVSVMANESKVRELITPYTEKVAIAAINGPESVVISGETEAIEAIISSLESEGIKTKRLQVSHPFHSPLMAPMLAEFEAVAHQITYHQPTIPLVSNVTGIRADDTITTANYWVNHVLQPVRFAQSMETLHQKGYEIFLEIGPKPILLGMGRQCLPEQVGVWLPSLREGVDEWQQMLSSLGQLYVQGVKVDWSGFDREYPRQKVVLPTYPFQRQRYWIDTTNQANSIPIASVKLHPLINKKIQSPLSKEIFFESDFSTTTLPFLADHRIYEKVVVPGASHISLLLAAASLTFPKTECQLEDIIFPQALAIPEQGVRTVQVTLTPQDSSYSFQVISFDDSFKNGREISSWGVHGTGKISPAPVEKSRLSLENFEIIKSRCSQKLESTEVYQYLWERKIQLGQSFRWIDQVWLGNGEVLCEMKVPSTVLDATKYQLHPALLDSCFQSVVALNLSLSDDNTETFVPFSIEKFSFYNPPENGVLWCYTRRSKDKQSSEKFKADLQLVDHKGELVAQVTGFEARKANPQTLLMTLGSDLSNWFYEINWQAIPLPSKTPSNQNQTGNWLVFALAGELIEGIRKSLEQKGNNFIWVSPGSEYQQLDAQHYQINPTVAEQFQKLLEDNGDLKGIVHLWGVNETNESLGILELEKAQELGCATVLHLVQALIQARLTHLPPIWLVTQGTQSVLDETEVVQPQQGALWGLGRVISLEYPELACFRVDLDPKYPVVETLPSLVDELLSDHNENQIAIRQGVRYVARLVPQQQQKLRSLQQLPIPEGQPLELKLSEYGLIDNLNWQPMQRRPPQAHEVEIQVKAVGLNFRDVLNALGLLKDYYAQHLGITNVEQLTLGLECVGMITSVGESVCQWQVGDQVMAVVPNGFSSFVTTAAELVIAKPKQISFTEAATLPLTFLTAYYGLQHLAQIQPGERVLIHAAAGGVGQAAVQIALQAGAEVFATASPPKWDFLKSMGVQHIMNSRTLEFASEIMNLTDGVGVDVVFNSLNGEFIDKSFAVLAPTGRFVEIGKIGIWDQQQVKQKRPNADYFPFDIGEVIQQQPDVMAQLSEELTQQWNQGQLKALPHKVFPSTEITAAFRYLQQAKHIGKVVVEMPETTGEPKSIKPEASYLITGGLGALGLEVAQWMVTQGAKHLALMGRRAPSQTAQKVIEELETAGAHVRVLLGDISHTENVALTLKEISASLPPLKGVIHAAGVLDDGLLQNMNWQQFTKVMAPKVAGTWHLHQLTLDLPLDFFVCFSSMASMLGSPAQGNYAAANGFMDAIAHYRRGQGLPGLSINWGPWAAGGMAARLDSLNQQRLDRSGMIAIKPEQGMQALGSLLSESQSQVGVFPINWSRFVSQLPGGQKMPFLSALISKSSLTQKSPFLLKFEATVPSERRSLLVDHVRSQVARVLGINNPKSISLGAGFFDLGMDSLTSVELRNKLQTSLECSLPSTLAFDYPTVDKLVDYLLQNVLDKESYETSVPKGAEDRNDKNQEQLLANTKELLEDDLEELINQEFSLLINE